MTKKEFKRSGSLPRLELRFVSKDSSPRPLPYETWLRGFGLLFAAKEIHHGNLNDRQQAKERADPNPFS